MIYVLHRQEYDDVCFYGVFEGPDGLDIDSLRKGFWAMFELNSSIPKYTGPMINIVHPPGLPFSGCGLDGPQIDRDSQEGKDYLAMVEEFHKTYAKNSQSLFRKIQDSYPGNDKWEMFISYLEKEYGMKMIDAKINRMN